MRIATAICTMVLASQRIPGEKKKVWLDYSGMKLREMPRDVYYRIIDQEEEVVGLDLSNNNIKQLPSWIGQLLYLEELDVSDNELEGLPSDAMRLICMIKLNLSNNKIVQFPKEITMMPHLQYLSIRDNQIRALPWDIGYMRGLRNFDAGNNGLESLPPSIANSKKLEILNLEGNWFETLPIGIGELTSLRKLILKNNKKLRIFPRELVTKLRKLKNLALIDLRCNNSLEKESNSEGVGWKELKIVFGDKLKLPQDKLGD